jgi:hypothetical protein
VKQPGSIGEAPNASQSGSGLVPESQEGKGREGKGREGNEEGKGVSRSSRARDADAIYAIYPKKKARIDALKAIEKAMKTIPVEILVEAVTAYAQAVSTWAPEEKQFIPDPSTWFNQGRWEDDRSTWEKRKSTIIAPSEEDWITECKRLNRSRANYEPEWPFETARAEFLRNQANGWRFVTDWKACAGAAHSKFLGMEAANQDRRSR